MPSFQARKRKFLEILPEMTRDIRNVHRGQCQACGDCEAFISVSGRVLCDYCGCPPAQHENLARENKKSRSSSSNSTSKTAESSPTDLSEVSSLEILELEDDEAEDSTHGEDTEGEESEEEEQDQEDSVETLDSSKEPSRSSQKSG